MQVLVADDDEAVRRALVHALRRDGYGVGEAASGGAALERTADGGYQAIVLDVLMPEPNGLEVCRILRGRGDETPILMLTARDLVADRVAGLDAGADDYLVNPSPWTSCGLGCVPYCDAPARPATRSPSPTSNSTSPPARLDAANVC